jgi:hypothetical protein
MKTPLLAQGDESLASQWPGRPRLEKECASDASAPRASSSSTSCLQLSSVRHDNLRHLLPLGLGAMDNGLVYKPQHVKGATASRSTFSIGTIQNVTAYHREPYRGPRPGRRYLSWMRCEQLLSSGSELKESGTGKL